MVDIEEISANCDLCLIKLFQVLEEIFTQRKLLDELISDGFINIAKARYIMGSNTITSLQYNEEDLNLSSVYVQCSPGPDDFILKNFRGISNNNRLFFSLLNRGDNLNNNNIKITTGVPPSTGTTDITTDIVVTNSSNNGLRHRKKGGVRCNLGGGDENETTVYKLNELNIEDDDNSGDESATNVENYSENRDGIIREEKVNIGNSIMSNQLGKEGNVLKYNKDDNHLYSKNPLLWFGILVPRQLRKSQDCFKDAIVISVKLADLYSQLQYLRKEFTVELKKKRDHLKEEIGCLKEERGHLKEELGCSKEERGHLKEELGCSKEERGHLKEELGSSKWEERGRSKEEISRSMEEIDRLKEETM